jgi:hypothetical protein
MTAQRQVHPNLFGSVSEAVAKLALRRARLEVAFQPLTLEDIMAKKAKKAAKKAKKAVKKKK